MDKVISEKEEWFERFINQVHSSETTEDFKNAIREARAANFQFLYQDKHQIAWNEMVKLAADNKKFFGMIEEFSERDREYWDLVSSMVDLKGSDAEREEFFNNVDTLREKNEKLREEMNEIFYNVAYDGVEKHIRKILKYIQFDVLEFYLTPFHSVLVNIVKNNHYFEGISKQKYISKEGLKKYSKELFDRVLNLKVEKELQKHHKLELFEYETRIASLQPDYSLSEQERYLDWEENNFEAHDRGHDEDTKSFREAFPCSFIDDRFIDEIKNKTAYRLIALSDKEKAKGE